MVLLSKTQLFKDKLQQILLMNNQQLILLLGGQVLQNVLIIQQHLVDYFLIRTMNEKPFEINSLIIYFPNKI